MSEPRTVAELLDVGERVLRDSSAIFEDHDNRAEAEELLATTLGVAVEQLDLDDVPARRPGERYLALVARRAAGEPLPHLTGHIAFRDLDLEVRPGAFVPRPSSELVVARAARRLRGKRGPAVVDACTGAGPIALAIAAERPDARVWGTDISPEGLRQARRNARRLDISNARFVQGDMYGGLPSALAGAVDVITAHVPYVPPPELADLPAEVKDHEPVSTLSGVSRDGLGLARRAVFEGVDWLKPGGWILVEISEDLAPKLERICRRAGLSDIGVAGDRYKLSVVVEARKTALRRRPERRGSRTTAR